jgi:hypothetical protein
MVRAQAVRPFLEPSVAGLDVRWMAGAGDVGFPRGLDLGIDLGEAASGEIGAAVGKGAATALQRVDDQVLDWLRRP